MRDEQIERLLSQAGAALAPDAEFEDELLLRMEAEFTVDRTPGSARARGIEAPVVPVITAPPDARRARRSGGRRDLLLVAASILVVVAALGAVARLSGGRSPNAPSAPPVTVPSTSSNNPDSTIGATEPLDVPGPDPVVGALAAACAQSADVLETILALGDPLGGPFQTAEDAVGDHLDQLRVVVDRYVAALEVGRVDVPVADAIARLSADIDASLALTARDRWNVARTSVPLFARELAAIDVALAEEGIDECAR